MITSSQRIVKRIFDVTLSVLLLPIFLVPVLVIILLATIDTKTWGVFQQERIGQNKKVFRIYKIRTLRKEPHILGDYDKSASAFGRFLRHSKIDEWPQLINVLLGHMSFVGPRPDVKGFADQLVGSDALILQLKPGITGPATIKYQNEDALLAMQDNPKLYNRTIIWPDKVKINKNYALNWSFYLDLKIILKSLI